MNGLTNRLPWSIRDPVVPDRVRLLVVRYVPQLLLLMLVVALLIIKPATLSPGNLKNIVINAAPTAVLALGAMWVLISGGLDLSAGYGVAMCAMVLGASLQNGSALATAIVLTILSGAALGFTNAVLIGVLGMTPFIATLATMVCAEGITLVLGNVGTVIINNSVLSFIGTGQVVGIPFVAVYALGVALVIGGLARYTRVGLRTYSLGSNREATIARGIPIVRLTFFIYVLSGFLTAATAILLVAHVQIVDPEIASLDMLLDAFAATILGGTSLFGGRGTVTGTLTGALIISLITTSLVTLGVGAQNIELLKGAMIVLAVVVDALVRRLEPQEMAGT